jgi:ubiquinone/menaquinone biosynthesis C-methylase UbiE
MANQPADYHKYRKFWEPADFTEARKLILDANNWDDFTIDTFKMLLTPEVDALLPTYGSALEIGCGVGRLMYPMASVFNEVLGIDISEGMVRLSKDYLAKLKNVLTILCDGETFPVQSNSMQFVYSVICFQHIPYKRMIQTYLKETHRVLQIDGVARIQTHKGTGTGAFNEWVGHFYPSIDSFADEFTNAGLTVVEKDEIGDYLWITAVKDECEL